MDWKYIGINGYPKKAVKKGPNGDAESRAPKMVTYQAGSGERFVCMAVYLGEKRWKFYHKQAATMKSENVIAWDSYPEAARGNA